jgi:hypothetical protein
MICIESGVTAPFRSPAKTAGLKTSSTLFTFENPMTAPYFLFLEIFFNSLISYNLENTLQELNPEQ